MCLIYRPIQYVAYGNNTIYHIGTYTDATQRHKLAIYYMWLYRSSFGFFWPSVKAA